MSRIGSSSTHTHTHSLTLSFPFTSLPMFACGCAHVLSDPKRSKQRTDARMGTTASAAVVRKSRMAQPLHAVESTCTQSCLVDCQMDALIKGFEVRTSNPQGKRSVEATSQANEGSKAGKNINRRDRGQRRGQRREDEAR